MLVRIVTPAAAGTRLGNRVTALRWGGLLRQLGVRVALDAGMPKGPADLLVALHARRSRPAVRAFRAWCPDAPVVVALTGTDVYEAGSHGDDLQETLEAATRVVALQPRVADVLPPELHARLRTIFQSARAAPRGVRPADGFVVAQLAHIRAVKEPFLAARAARRLSAESRVRVVHFGRALDADAERQARAEVAENPRYEWRGDVPRAGALAGLAGSDALVMASRLEGGANALSEGIAAGVPILSTRIPGSVGILGDGYPGYFPVGDEAALAALLSRIEEDAAFRSELLAWAERLRPLVKPAREREAWADLLTELGLPVTSPDVGSTRLSIVATPVASERAALSRDVAEGLSRRPRELSCQFLYDLEGSALFEQICRTPEYYLTRTERAILTERAPALAAAMPPGALLYELGCGNAEKTRIVLDALCRRQSRTVFVPVDISRDMLVLTARALLREQPALEIRAIAGEYEAGLGELARPVGGVPPARLVLWLGSNIGNFARPAAVAFLAHVRQALSPSDRLLVGIDLRKSREVLEPAYDDAQGVTARFSKNLLARINRELDANFVLEAWAHRARYDEREGRVVIGLVSRKPQVVRVGALDLEVAFAEGEVIHTEDSHKYSFAEIDALAGGAGLRVAERWTDEEVRFAVVVFAPA